MQILKNALVILDSANSTVEFHTLPDEIMNAKDPYTLIEEKYNINGDSEYMYASEIVLDDKTIENQNDECKCYRMGFHDGEGRECECECHN